jgi:hypothetical protein
MCTIISIFYYSSLLPHAPALAMLHTFFAYWSFKYNLLRKNKMPETNFSALMGTYFT